MNAIWRWATPKISYTNMYIASKRSDRLIVLLCPPVVDFCDGLDEVPHDAVKRRQHGHAQLVVGLMKIWIVGAHDGGAHIHVPSPRSC